MDAAERLFSEVGYAEASMRSITQAAEANLAAVHYHFGSKVELFQAVLGRRLGPVNAERLRLLTELEAQPVAPELEDLLGAFFAPVMALMSGPNGPQMARLLARMMSAPGEHWVAMRALFEEIAQRFGEAFAQALPKLEHQDLMWRIHMLIGGLCTVMQMAETHAETHKGPEKLTHEETPAGQTCCLPAPGDLLQQVIAFGAGALRAPSANRE